MAITASSVDAAALLVQSIKEILEATVSYAVHKNTSNQIIPFVLGTVHFRPLCVLHLVPLTLTSLTIVCSGSLCSGSLCSSPLFISPSLLRPLALFLCPLIRDDTTKQTSISHTTIISTMFNIDLAFLPSCPLLATSPTTLSKSSVLVPRISVRKRTRPITRGVYTAVTDVGSPQPTNTSPSTSPTLDSLLKPRDKRRFIFFGGKGGVGKTSSSAAAAVRCADAGLTTLVISTDPAHSLGDALRLDLSDGKLHRVDDVLPLYAIESDTREAVHNFRGLVASLNSPDTYGTDDAAQDGVDSDVSGWAAVADRLGLQEFGDVLETIPPGADELIALVAVLDLVESNSDVQFDRIIIDTAPTGHTLRFLAFPDFLDKFLEQALSLREKLENARGILGNVTKMFIGKKVDVSAALQTASLRIAKYREKMIQLSDLFRDPERTEFVVVTIGTGLAIAESKRLIQHLWDEGIWVRFVIMNQVLPVEQQTTIDKYLMQVRKGQAREISFATEQIADEYGLSTTLIPRFDSEVRGVYGLRALGSVAFQTKRRETYGRVFDTNATVSGGEQSQFVFVGGKGGVGKTSVSAGMGVTLAESGLKTLILSTDPAHSLADALQIPLDGGRAVEIEDVDGELFAMEIDTKGAITEFQELAREFVSEGRRGLGVDVARKLGLEEFASLLDNAPPGIDELVALTQVMELVKFGDFDRVVVDTAPTGHTLRLLSFPEFLDSFLGKVMRLKQRLDGGMEALRSMLGRREPVDAVDRAARGVTRLRENMVELKELVGDKQRTQFAIVTVPTGLAMAESERLVKQLRADGVEVNNLVINQIMPDGSAAEYVERRVREQGICLEEMRAAGDDKGIEVVEVPFFDVEVRGVYGLRAMGCAMMQNVGNGEN